MRVTPTTVTRDRRPQTVDVGRRGCDLFWGRTRLARSLASSLSSPAGRPSHRTVVPVLTLTLFYDALALLIARHCRTSSLPACRTS